MASGVSFVESVVFMDTENDYRYYEWSTLITIDFQSSITIVDETPKLLQNYFIQMQKAQVKSLQNTTVQYVDYTQSTNDYGEIYEIILDTGDMELNLVYAWDYNDSVDSYNEFYYKSLTKEDFDETKKENEYKIIMLNR